MCNTLRNVPHVCICMDVQHVSASDMELTQRKLDRVEDSERHRKRREHLPPLFSGLHQQCCVLYEGPEKIGFHGLAQVRFRMCHRQWYYYREPCRGKWQASNGRPCLMHSHHRQGGSLFFSHATDLSPREATSCVRELIPGFSTAPRDTRILSQKSGAKGAVWQWRVVELGFLCAWACRKRLPGELWHKFKMQHAW